MVDLGIIKECPLIFKGMLKNNQLGQVFENYSIQLFIQDGWLESSRKTALLKAFIVWYAMLLIFIPCEYYRFYKCGEKWHLD